MVVDNFNIMGMTVFPDKTDPPLAVDPNAVLAFAVSRKCLEPIARWNAQVVQSACGVQDQQFLTRLPFKTGKCTNIPVLKDCLRISVRKIEDHDIVLFRFWYSVKGYGLRVSTWVPSSGTFAVHKPTSWFNFQIA
jgi:hypothetical protein